MTHTQHDIKSDFEKLWIMAVNIGGYGNRMSTEVRYARLINEGCDPNQIHKAVYNYYMETRTHRKKLENLLSDDYWQGFVCSEEEKEANRNQIKTMQSAGSLPIIDPYAKS